MEILKRTLLGVELSLGERPFKALVIVLYNDLRDTHGKAPVADVSTRVEREATM
jgi:hypothetical protein